MKALALLTLLLFAAPAVAGECHVAGVTPHVTSWTITGRPGGLVVDATLYGSPYFPPSQYFETADGDDWWWHDLHLRPEGATGFYNYVYGTVTVTDTTFHLEATYPAGTYEYLAFVGGWHTDEPQQCSYAYEWIGTLTIPDPTPARRASWGAVRTIWR